MKKTFSYITIILVMVISASLALASGNAEGGHESSAELWKGWGLKTFNFLVLIGLLYWLLASKIRDFFVGRRAEIKEDLEKAVERKAEAEKKYREYSEKIDKASTEIDGILEMIKAQGVAEKQKIIEDAERTAKKMKEDAQARIEQEMKKATDDLKAQAVNLSVKMAEEILKKSITQDDHKSMVKDYIDKVVIKH
ncbi:MAG TPA: F0F1 ATP synthase subunit B [Smithella sp.]|nr:F0F1 ATP synthase subunit B [Smithella sp.]MDM7986482.1 F0F1 ATP synthase subunit B [Smithella sp.]HNY50248.1 F0F1 ATP synthase subunit B [Smithella sp.]HOG89919.1 F0F1 ATP synthase subunit B [Smithella sp.]HOU49833.1 F0F1 ATP synthase subunit B [Smithella sp.]